MNRRDVLRTSLLLSGSVPFGASPVGALGTTDDEPAFYDDWEDGDYTTDPGWRVYNDEGDFSAQVRSQSTPRGGQRVLQIHETWGGGSDGILGWQTGLTGWDGEWTFSGLFYTQNVPLNSDFQGHNVILYDDPNENNGPIKAHLGFVDSNGNQKPFAIDGDLVDSIEKIEHIDWEEDVWYHYEVEHDGDGMYTGRIWEDGTGRPTAPNAVSSGSAPGMGERFGSLQINGAHYQAFDVNHAFVEWQRSPSSGGPSKSLEALIDQKRAKIGAIQSAAGTSLGAGEAESTVDKRAEQLLVDIEEDAFEASEAQYREALERMNAAEEVTQTATDIAIEDGALVDSTVSNVWSASVSAASELASKVGGSILKRVFDGLMNSLNSITGRLLDSLRGAGAISDDAADDILDKAREMQTRHFYTMQAVPENDRGEITRKFGGDGVSETADAARSMGLVESLKNETEELQAELEEYLFENFYYRKSPQTFAAMIPPTPDEIELPDVHADVDVPDEMLPWWVDDSLRIPDEISIDFTADVDLPEVPVLDDLNDVKNGANVDLSGAGGVNAVVDEAMDDLDDLLGTLGEQDDAVREDVSAVGRNSTAVLSNLAEHLVTVVEDIQEGVLKDVEDLVTLLMVVGVAGTAILLATGVGAVLMVQATILMAQVATVLSAMQVILDVFQTLAGVGTLGMMAVVHYIAVDAITSSDLGGVTVD